MRAEMVEHTEPSRTVAESDELLAQQHQPQLCAVTRDLRRQAGQRSLFLHQPSHQRAGADGGERLVPGTGVVIAISCAGAVDLTGR